MLANRTKTDKLFAESRITTDKVWKQYYYWQQRPIGAPQSSLRLTLSTAPRKNAIWGYCYRDVDVLLSVMNDGSDCVDLEIVVHHMKSCVSKEGGNSSECFPALNDWRRICETISRRHGHMLRSVVLSGLTHTQVNLFFQILAENDKAALHRVIFVLSSYPECIFQSLTKYFSASLLELQLLDPAACVLIQKPNFVGDILEKFPRLRVFVCQARILVLVRDGKHDSCRSNCSWKSLLDAVEYSSTLERVDIKAALFSDNVNKSSNEPCRTLHADVSKCVPGRKIVTTNSCLRKLPLPMKPMEATVANNTVIRMKEISVERQYSLDFALQCNNYRRLTIEKSKQRTTRTLLSAAMDAFNGQAEVDYSPILDATMRVLQDWYRMTHRPRNGD